jgi:serine phosphatase RsbU (regulator of sigma subunit)
MAKRSGPSISVKMILTTTLLILLTVVGFGVLNVLNIRRVYDENSRRDTELFRRSLESKGETDTPMFARALAPMLINAGQDAELFNLAKTTVQQDTRDDAGRRDYGLQVALVLDRNKQLAAYCVEGAELSCKPFDPHVPVSEASDTPAGKIIAEAWKKSLESWSAGGAKGEVLAKFDLTDGNSKYRFFAYPVFAGAPPTAAAAVAEDPGENRHGYIVFGYDLAPLDWFKLEAEKLKADESTKAAVWTGAVGALFVLIGTLLAIFQGLQISKPIKLLAWKADQIARGDLEARVEVKSTDEIGILGENFNFMADQLVILLHQTAEKARLEQELEVARTIQETLVPPNEPIERGHFKFAGFFQPASQCGGDWWTWHELTGDKILVVIGDVTGHGVPSAMITAAAKAACDVARSVYNDDVTVTKLLEIMNYAIFESAKRKFVMTCFASIVDTRRRTITYANAGHNFPYLFRTGEDGKGEFGSLMIRGNRLGDLRESRYEAKTTELLPGDILVWYTDGIVECENGAGEEYGEKRFRASVRRAAALDAGEMRDAVVADAATFFAEMARKDDITMVVGRIH